MDIKIRTKLPDLPDGLPAERFTSQNQHLMRNNMLRLRRFHKNLKMTWYYLHDINPVCFEIFRDPIRITG
ncbi:hypothetical protein D3C81_1571690 [compost metagenome]